MTVKEFVELWADGTHEDIDVYDNVCELLAIAYCGTQLTKAGEEHFKEVLDYEILVMPVHNIAVIDVDGPEGVWQKKLKIAKEFFYSAAGYCAETDYDKWFKD